MTVVRLLVVRHAHAGDRDRWRGDDRLRPLSAKGRRQAQAVVSLLAAERMQRLLSSPYERCMQTFAPASGRLGIPIEPRPELEEGAGAAIIGLLLSADRPLAACTHGDVMTELHDHLLAAGLTDRRGATEKGAAWILEATSGRFTRADYHPA